MKRGAFIMHEEKITRTEFEAVRPDYNSEISAVIRGNDTPKVMQKQTWGLPRKRHRGGYPTAFGRWMQETLSGMFGRNSVGCFWASWGSAGGRVSRRNGFKATSHKAYAQIAPPDFSSDCTSSTSAGWPPAKENLWKMTKNMQARYIQSACFVRCCHINVFQFAWWKAPQPP